VKVLIAEDDPVTRSTLGAFLADWGYEVIMATNGKQALGILQQDNAPRLAILDRMMPGMDGTQVCQEVRKRTDPPYTYIILLTAKTQKRDLIVGLEAGADDFLRKPLYPKELMLRLLRGRRILDLQEQLLAAREALLAQATQDSLTGLWNHAAILQILERELARADRDGSRVGVLMADLDHFKSVNDSFGHLAGDAVLLEIATRMRKVVRLYDAVGRYGGEEFLIVCPSCDSVQALHLAERLRAGIGEEPVSTPSDKITLTVSVGIAVGERSLHPNSLLRAADMALYRAKHRGRNRVEKWIAIETNSNQAPVRGMNALEHRAP
jgi:diguanylate cyclase (GGDEF)-like protein